MNALSSHLKVTVRRNGKTFQQEYNKGIPKYPVKETGTTDVTGTEVHFTPDDSIFNVSEYNYDTIASRLRELSFLNAGIKINLIDLREKDDDGNYKKDCFLSEGGLVEFVDYLDSTRESLIPTPGIH